MRPLPLPALSLLIGLAMGDAAAGLSRFALFIGSDRGLEGEVPLRYAASDAASLGGFLGKHGRFQTDVVEVLRNPGLHAVREKLGDLERRAAARKRSGDQVYFLLYYSGHGSADALHIHGERLPRAEFRAMVDAVASDLRILIVDACESGGFLRDKGARYLAEEPRVFEKPVLGSTGSISISATSKGEWAQESEDFRGGVFTHHLLNGLRGLADYNRDRAVTVLEAFDYAHVSTRKEAIAGSASRQSPTFDFDVQGSSDPELAWLGKGESRVVFTGVPTGILDVYDGKDLSLAARLNMTGQDTIAYQVPSGKYLFVHHGQAGMRIYEADFTWLAASKVDFGRFRPSGKAPDRGKGARRISARPQAGRVFLADMAGGRLPRMGLAGVSYSHGLGRDEVRLSAGYGDRMEYGNTGLQVRSERVRLGLGWLRPVFRHPYGDLHAGGELAFNRLLQEAEDRRFGGVPVAALEGNAGAPFRAGSNIYEGMAEVGLTFHFPFRLSLGTSLAGGARIFKDRARGRMEAAQAWSSGLSLGLGL